MRAKAAVAVMVILGAVLAMPAPVSAQFFGKNVVQWQKSHWRYYENKLADGEPGHFAFYLALDLNEVDVLRELQATVNYFEESYTHLSTDLKFEMGDRRIIVVIARTHSVFEGLKLSGGEIMTEGVGAYAFPRGSRFIGHADLVLVIKPDFLPNLNRTIYIHELAHIFQFGMAGKDGLSDFNPNIPGWIYEAAAEYLAGRHEPYARDDIRRRRQRIAASNARDTDRFPTLQSLEWGEADPYASGEMVFEFLAHRFGEEKTVAFIQRIFKERRFTRFMSALEDLSGGAFPTPERFDRAHRDYWQSVFAKDALARDKPYETTDHTLGREVLKYPWPYQLTSPRIAPDGTQVVFITSNPKSGLVIATAPALDRNTPPYIANPDHRERERVRRAARERLGLLTTFIPPEHYEYLIAQEQIVWPFNGSDLSWWQEPAWAAQSRRAYDAVLSAQMELATAKGTRPSEGDKKFPNYRFMKSGAKDLVKKRQKELNEATGQYAKLHAVKDVSLVAYFARHNRDHALFVQDANTRRIVRVIDLPLDQAFSPAFSPDGTTIYFSAAHNTKRGIYTVRTDGTAAPVPVTSEGTFNSAPAISPDGTKLVYVAFVGEMQKLFLRDLTTGDTTQLTGGAYNDNSPAWSSDGTTIAFTSDQKDRIWNLYTLELATQTVRRWTDFFGGVYTPSFVPGESDRVVCAALVEDHQHANRIFPAFELFDVRLKEPMSVASAVPEPLPGPAVAQVTGPLLDQEQITGTATPPARWKFSESNLLIYGSSRGGFAAYLGANVQDLLGDHRHEIVYAKSRYLQLGQYRYVNQSDRLSWTGDASFSEYPLIFTLGGLWGQYPTYPAPNGNSYQYFLNWTRLHEQSASVGGRYPFSKWSRIEFGLRARHRLFTFPYTVPDVNPYPYPSAVYDTDRQFSDYFTSANTSQTSAGITAAYVHDTVLYAEEALGPVNGTALRVQAEIGRPFTYDTSPFGTYMLSGRQYLRLSGRSVLAMRIDGLYSTRPDGDVMFLGGNDSLRNYPFYSVACDRCLTGSVELRVPVGDAVLFGTVPLKIRGTLFGDVAHVQLNSTRISEHQEWAYGAGLQVWLSILPFNFEWARTQVNPDHFTFHIRVGVNF